MAKYSKGAGKKVGEVMHEKKKGTLKSGSGKKVTSRKQAIAIGLSEAREKGEKVPKKGGSKSASKGRGASTKKSSSKKSASKSSSKSTAKKSAGKSSSKSTSKKSSSKKSSSKKSSSKKSSSKKSSSKKGR